MWLPSAGTLAIEEFVTIVDTNSRKIISAMQRMRRQKTSKPAVDRGKTLLRLPLR